MSIAFPYHQEYNPPAPFVEATIGAESQEVVYALIDSGADVTMLPERILHQINALHIRTRGLRGITGHPVMVEIYLVEVKIDTYSIPAIPAVAIDSGEVIIGRDVLQHLIVTLDGIASTCEVS